MSSAAFHVRDLARVLVLACLPGLLACTGCGSGPSLVPVQGKVSVGGQPLTGGAVVFMPTEPGAPNVSIIGTIGADGTYTMTTDGKAGAPKGKYKVAVNTVVLAVPHLERDKPTPSLPPAAAPQRKANAKYESPTTTDLTVEVPSSSYDLNLSPP